MINSFIFLPPFVQHVTGLYDTFSFIIHYLFWFFSITYSFFYVSYGSDDTQHFFGSLLSFLSCPLIYQILKKRSKYIKDENKTNNTSRSSFQAGSIFIHITSEIYYWNDIVILITYIKYAKCFLLHGTVHLGIYRDAVHHHNNSWNMFLK